MNVLNNKTYTFSGHESFPCKTLWTKKGYDFVTAHKDFNSPNAVVDLGVGKNMVSSIRYWYKVFGLDKGAKTEWLAEYIFSTDIGKDPFTEDLGTLWLLHFLLVYTGEASSYKLFFVDFQKERRLFDREQVVSFVKRKMAKAEKQNMFRISWQTPDID